MQPLTRTDIPATRPNGLTSHPGSTQTVFGERSIYRRGEPITDTSTDFLRVERGVVALYRLMPGRRSICVGLLGPGDVLRVPHASDVRADALTDVQVLGLDHRALVGLISSSPVLAEQIVASMTNQLDHVETLLQRVLGRDITVRLGGMLLELAERCGRDNGSGLTEIIVPTPHKLLARMIGGNRVTVTRVIAELRDGGVVVSPKRNHVLVDVEGMRQFLDERTAAAA